MNRAPTLSLLLLLAVAPGALRAQPALQDELFERHLRNVYLERRLAFEQAWNAADEEARARATELVKGRESLGVPGVHTTSAQVFTEMRARMVAPAGRTTEARIAESLDLRVLPGAFAATPTGGEEMIVRVLPVYTRILAKILPAEIELTLWWVSPDGDQIRARSEPVHRDALALPGFEMYFRAPPSEPGVWELVPEVRVGERVGRGVPIRVECIDRLYERYDRLATTEPAARGGEDLRQILDAELLFGARDARYPSISALLDGRAEEPAFERWTSEEGGGETVELARAAGLAEEDIVQQVVVVVSRPELAEWGVTGARGAAWSRFAERARARVIVTSLALRSSAGPDVLELLATLERPPSAAPVTLVVHGSDSGRLSVSLRGAEVESPPFDRLVLDSVLLGAAKPQRYFRVPTLFFDPLDEATGLVEVELDEPGPPVHWARSADPPSIASSAVPGALVEWLGLLDADR